MSKLEILAELWALLQKYGPQAGAVAAGAVAAFEAGGWAGVVTYLESVILNPPTPLPTMLRTELLVLQGKMKAA